MGIDFHALNFLKYISSGRPMGDVVTIGRQELHVNAIELRRILGDDALAFADAYCDPLLTAKFGATRVDAIDNCDYEGATHILDMSKPVPEALHGRYDTVIDAGTTEHIFDAPQALRNCSDLMRPGGQIIHILPANNYCGHGFWQFSPELFFSLYSAANGYRDTEVFLADFTQKKRWFKVREPRDGNRVNVMSLGELYVMVRSVREGARFSHEHVQQSDYVHEWQTRVVEPVAMTAPSGVKAALMGNRLLYDTLFPLYHKVKRLTSSERFSARNRGLEVFPIPG